MASNDSTQKTIIVALSLCVVCSIIVSAATVMLRPIQQENQILDRQKNLLLTAGLISSSDVSKQVVEEQLKKVEPILVDLEKDVQVEGLSTEEVARFDERTAVKDPKQSIVIPANKDLGQIKVRTKLAKIYLIKENDQVEKVVVPVHGKGLWSTLYGLLVLKKDLQTVEGLSFYDQKETPGLGGEVDNPLWKAKWVGKKIYGEEGRPQIMVTKGMVDPQNPKAFHQVDGLSGATITSQGVTNLLRYWLGEDGFGPFLDKLRKELANS